MNKALIVILFCFCGLQNVWPQAQPPANAPADLNRNFVRTEKILAPGVTSENSVSNLPVEQKATTYAYVDDMGRPVQSITVQGSPEKRDVVQFHHYDAFGRQLQEYLPYTFNNSTGYGTYRTGYLAEQASFYTGTPAIAQDVAPYKLNIFDNSPLNQVRTTYGPGARWHPTQANKPVRSKITTNSTNEVRKWTYTGTGFPTTGTSDYYAGNILLATEEIDEENFVRLTYKNFKDQVILEKTGDGTAWHETYYVYDYAGNLMFVFPPEAVARLETEYIPAGANKQQFLDRWVFQYEYDAWQRMTGKKVPGSGWVYHIYDKWDRLILTQDANQRASNQWSFTKYDELNRPVLSGFTTGSRSALQNSVNVINNRFFETRNSNSIGYTNTAFPSHSESSLLTITYYDDYNFKSYTNWDAEGPGSAYNYVVENGFPAASQILSLAKGYTTGTKTKVLGDTRWLNTVTYYDKKYNTIQVIAENYIGGKDRITNDIDFAGRTLKNLHVHTNTMASVTKLAQFTYDHAGRLENVYHTLDNSSPVLVASHKYNELGQLIEKNLHSEDEGNTFLQSVDYRYNIRGWLTHINNSTLTNDGTINNDANDLFGMDIIYNQEQVSVGGTNTTKLYNGNISSIRWKSNNLWDPPQEKIYRYQYDPWSRMQLAYYAHKNGSSWNDAPGAFNETVGYDKNGNIQNLLRTGLMGSAVTEIDNLGYQYTGNQLKNVHDYSEYWWLDYGNPDIGFSEIFHDTGLTEYTYDANGNMTSDMNKGIESITYNYLNLPVQITLENNRFIEYTYDALGNKLRTIARAGSDVKSKTEYVGSIHYQDGQLAFILTDEGRVVKRNGAFDYEYFLKDHQRNTRVVFGPLKVTEAFKATLEPERNNRETADFRNITRAVGYNHTPKNYETPHPQYGASLNGAVGPAKMLSVQQGDKLRLMAHSRYHGGTVSSSKILPAALASAVTSAFQLLPSGETSTAYNALNGGVLGATVNEYPNVPKAYLCYFIFNSSYTWHQFGYYAVSNASTVAFEQLQLDVEVNFPAGSSTGFIYVYVANETTGKAVVFDDIEIIHEKNQRALQVVQASDYYPFGLRIPLSYQKPTLDLARTKNKYTFQEQEVQDGFDLNWYQYKYRMHDPAIGRFGAVDPLTEKFYYNSTYAFSENKLVDGIELEGLEHVLTIYSPDISLKFKNAVLSGDIYEQRRLTYWALNNNFSDNYAERKHFMNVEKPIDNKVAYLEYNDKALNGVTVKLHSWTPDQKHIIQDGYAMHFPKNSSIGGSDKFYPVDVMSDSYYGGFDLVGWVGQGSIVGNQMIKDKSIFSGHIKGYGRVNASITTISTTQNAPDVSFQGGLLRGNYFGKDALNNSLKDLFNTKLNNNSNNLWRIESSMVGWNFNNWTVLGNNDMQYQFRLLNNFVQPWSYVSNY